MQNLLSRMVRLKSTVKLIQEEEKKLYAGDTFKFEGTVVNCKIMIVKKDRISNFRNYKLFSLELDDKTNILYGKNAQGKTNMLEAIYVCSTTKSHRSSKDAELINLENNEGHIKVLFGKKAESIE